MHLFIKKMDRRMAAEILLWRYEPPYDFYNNDLTDGNIHEMLHRSYYAVVDIYGCLVGFFCLGESARVPNGTYSENMIDIGLGLEPGRTGKGMGYFFFSYILHHIQHAFPFTSLRLTVASFNERAIRLYIKSGFQEHSRFNKGETVFIIMVKHKALSTNR